MSNGSENYHIGDNDFLNPGFMYCIVQASNTGQRVRSWNNRQLETTKLHPNQCRNDKY